MKKSFVLIAFVLMVACIACNKARTTESSSVHEELSYKNAAGSFHDNTGENEKSTLANTNITAKPASAPTAIIAPEKVPSKIIRNAIVRMKVKSLAESTSAIENLLAKYNAYAANETQDSRNGNFENNVVIRVPQNYFEKLLNEVMTQAEFVDMKNITADDVTAEYVDAQTRLRTKHQVLERYYDLMKRAGKITDILEVEEKIRVLQEEIESMEGRIKLMNDRSAYSTIAVTLYELRPAEAIPGIGAGSRMLTAIKNGWNNIVSFIIFSLNFWPFLLIIVPTIIYWRRKKTVKLA